MSSFQEEVYAYGADYQAIIERFMGDETLYLKFLNMLPQDTNLRKLGDSLRAENLSDAFEAAHTLKGVAGNLALTPLYQAVSAIVEPLRAGERQTDYIGLYETIQTEFQRADEFRKRLQGGYAQ